MAGVNRSDAGGFTPIPNWVIRDSDLAKNEMLVYIALLSRVDQYGQAWPSIPTLAHDSRLSDRSVQETLKLLEKRGVVKRTIRRRGDGSNHSNMYDVAVFDRTPPERPSRARTPRNARTPTVQGLRTPGAEVAVEEEPLEEDPVEEEMRPKQEFGRDHPFAFIDPNPPATPEQVAYLGDLHLHHNNTVADEKRKAGWAALTQEEASALINRYLAVVGRYDDYQGPEAGEPTYDALSDSGKVWADALMIPEAV